MFYGEQRVSLWVCLLLISVVRQSAAVALLGDCSADPASCDAGLVCDVAGGNTCRVKADGTTTDCTSDNANCPSHATCTTTVCNCNSGYIDDGTGLCTVQNAVCSSGTACGDTTNYVCDTTSNVCKVKADGSASTCASDNGNCPSHATCSSTTCSCAAGYTNDGTGLCTAIINGFTCANNAACTALDANSECDAGTNKCACVSGYAGSAGDTCQANDGTSLTTSGIGIYLGILLFFYILS